jgi:predicted RNase H-like HicB family nuclease
MNTMRYAIVIEKSANGFGAYVPDLPGCVAMGDTVQETERLIREAIALHLAAMREEGQQIPQPSTLCDYVEVQP